ncbi:MAG TPA: iron-containing redox enzyme family protein [Mycobacteriales bacterium]|nr:iron-containing redox enzyme family protein [Mycobacteriales bacterium]
MRPADARTAIESALHGRWLLDHPFYRRWSAGTVTREELTRYAGQYRHFEAALPAILSEIADGIPPSTARDAVLAGLADESGGGGTPSHLELFDEFAGALGAGGGAPASAATGHLTSVYATAAGAGPVAALAAVGAYELQAADIAASKALGLRRHFQLDGAAIRFWDLHAELDRDHADWTTSALADLATDERQVTGWARAAADAWWRFLDERDEASADVA